MIVLLGNGLRAIQYSMQLFLEQCIERYQQLLPKRVVMMKVPTPFVDLKNFKDSDFETKGELHNSAAMIMMKILYCARMCRRDLLRATCALASRVSKCAVYDDQAVFRMMCYIHTTLDYCLRAVIGDEPSKWWVDVFADSDLASDVLTRKSTSGIHVSISAPRTCFPIHGASTKEDSIASSTPEAELVSAHRALRTEAYPVASLLELICERPVDLFLHEDNTTCITTIKNGFSVKMRHLARVHGISCAWMTQQFQRHGYSLVYVPTECQQADIFTKPFIERIKWEKAVRLINIGPSRPTSARLADIDVVYEAPHGKREAITIIDDGDNDIDATLVKAVTSMR